MNKRSDYDPPKGVKQCPSHRLGLTKDTRDHMWTDRDGNWTCIVHQVRVK